MEKEQKIAVEQYCIYHSIETSFVYQLEEHGLIELSQTESNSFITYNQLPDLERYIRLHYDLEINLAGIDTIRHLLSRMQQLQQQVKILEGQLDSK